MPLAVSSSTSSRSAAAAWCRAEASQIQVVTARHDQVRHRS
jgi:hypothetical protein